MFQPTKPATSSDKTSAGRAVRAAPEGERHGVRASVICPVSVNAVGMMG